MPSDDWVWIIVGTLGAVVIVGLVLRLVVLSMGGGMP
jgi:hypothetical protein